MKHHTTLKELRSHNPCARGWKTLLDSLPPDHTEDTPIDFLSILESNGLEDTLWALRVLPKAVSVTLACDFVERVLRYVPEGENRPAEAICAARAWVENPSYEAAANAANAAANAAAYAANAHTEERRWQVNHVKEYFS